MTTKPRHVALTAASTALAVLILVPEVMRTGVWGVVLIALVLASPIGSALEIAALRRQGRDETAAEAGRWMTELALTVLVIVAVSQFAVTAN